MSYVTQKTNKTSLSSTAFITQDIKEKSLLSATVGDSKEAVFSENFSNGSLPDGWSNIDNSGGGVWQFNNPGNKTLNSTTAYSGFAIFDSYYYGNDGKAENADLITPAIDCSALSAVTFTFEHYFAGFINGAGQVYVSNDNGSTWTSLDSWSATTTANAVFEEYDITAFAAGQSQVKIKWNWQGDHSYYWAIDDIKVFEPYTHDLAVEAINSPAEVFSDSIVSPVVTIENKGHSTEYDYKVLLSDGASYNKTINVTASITPLSSFNVAFPDWTPGDGTYNLTATVTVVGDTNIANNSKNLSVVASPAEHTLGIYSIDVPLTVFSDSIVSPKVRVVNFSDYAESTYTVSLTDSVSYNQTVDVVIPIGKGRVSTISFPDWIPTEGTYTLTATVTSAGDVNGSDNSSTRIVKSIKAKHDLAVNAINIPQVLLSNSPVTPVIAITNAGNYTESAYSVLLSDGGAYSETVNVTDPVAVGAGYNVSFPDWIPTVGSHTLKATVALIGDMAADNDSMTLDVTASAAKHDLAVSSINVPSKVFSDSLVSPVVTIKNTGDFTEATYSVLISDGSAYNAIIDLIISIDEDDTLMLLSLTGLQQKVITL